MTLTERRTYMKETTPLMIAKKEATALVNILTKSAAENK